jgi:hypothetical protein
MIIGKAISPFAIKRRNGGAANDADAQAFITASGISGTNATATNQLVIDLKTANVWTKIKAAYPMVGGTATSCKWNLKNPVDSNAAYRLVFSGGGTFSANGYLPNGVNAFGETYLTPLTALTLNSTHLSYYSRTNINTDITNIGTASGSDVFTLYCSYLNQTYSSQYNGSAGRILGTVTRGDGFFLGNRTASNNHNAWRNSTKLITSTTSVSIGSLPSISIRIGSVAGVGTDSLKQCAFASIGDGLTDAEALAFYNAVQTFNTTLGRQV